MEWSRLQNRVGACAANLLVKSMVAAVLCFGSVVCAQAQEAQPNITNESWTATTQTFADIMFPSQTRTTENHVQTGNRTVDKRNVEVLGPNGRYQPDYETEKELVQVNETTTRTMERTYKWDVNGQRNLLQVTEEEAQTAASGDAQMVRTTSVSDGNGNLHVVQREVAETTTTGPGTRETKTTFYRPDGDGDLAPTAQTQELQTTGSDHTVAEKKTTLVPDSSGRWEVVQVQESTIKEDGENRTGEERVSRADSEGRLSEVTRTVDSERETDGEKHTTEVTYSSWEVPGLAPDGTLHLSRQVTMVQKMDSGEKTIDQQVEQPKLDDPNAGLEVRARTKYVVEYGTHGTQETTTTQLRDGSGNLNVVSVETRESDQVSAEQQR